MSWVTMTKKRSKITRHTKKWENATHSQRKMWLLETLCPAELGRRNEKMQTRLARWGIFRDTTVGQSSLPRVSTSATLIFKSPLLKCPWFKPPSINILLFAMSSGRRKVGPCLDGEGERRFSVLLFFQACFELACAWWHLVFKRVAGEPCCLFLNFSEKNSEVI